MATGVIIVATLIGLGLFAYLLYLTEGSEGDSHRYLSDRPGADRGRLSLGRPKCSE